MHDPRRRAAALIPAQDGQIIEFLPAAGGRWAADDRPIGGRLEHQTRRRVGRLGP